MPYIKVDPYPYQVIGYELYGDSVICRVDGCTCGASWASGHEGVCGIEFVVYMGPPANRTRKEA